MSDIFICYKREDEAKARKLVDALESEGWTIWCATMLQKRRAGEHVDIVIEKEMKEAKCAIMLWSERSIVSDYVLAEADYFSKRRILIPVLIEDVQPPIGFRAIQPADLSQWDGSPSSPEFQQLAQDVKVVLLGAVEIRGRSQTATTDYLRSLEGEEHASSMR